MPESEANRICITALKQSVIYARIMAFAIVILNTIIEGFYHILFGNNQATPPGKQQSIALIS